MPARDKYLRGEETEAKEKENVRIRHLSSRPQGEDGDSEDTGVEEDPGDAQAIVRELGRR